MSIRSTNEGCLHKIAGQRTFTVAKCPAAAASWWPPRRFHAGMIHAGQIVTVVAEDGQFRLVIGDETVAVVPRTTTREIHRYKAYKPQASRHAPGTGTGDAARP